VIRESDNEKMSPLLVGGAACHVNWQLSHVRLISLIYAHVSRHAGKNRTLTNVACLRPVFWPPATNPPPAAIFAHKAMCYATLIGVYCEGRDAWLCSQPTRSAPT